MENKKMKITTPQQFERLVALMEDNQHLATGFRRGLHKHNIKDEWNKIADTINCLGPPIRPGEGWKKVWEDYKFKLKKKLMHNKIECSATGEGPFKQFVLSATDEAAANLLQLNSLISPVESIEATTNMFVERDDDCNNNSKENYIPLSPENRKEGQMSVKKDDQNVIRTEMPSTSKFAKYSNKAQKTKSDLLSEQLKVQTDLYTEVKSSLKELERYSRKSFKLEEEKLKLYKNELKNKEEYRRSLYLLKKEEIQIKKRKIELEEMKCRF